MKNRNTGARWGAWTVVAASLLAGSVSAQKSGTTRSDPLNPVTGQEKPLGAVVQRCVEKKPEDRWQSTRDMQWVLEEIRSTAGAVPAALAGGAAAEPSAPVVASRGSW